VAIKFEIDSDQGLAFGGWTLDDVCVVGWVPTVCGDGQITGGEECDDGDLNSDTEPDACRTDCMEALCGDGTVDSGEECDDGNLVDDDGCEADCTPTPEQPPNEGDGAPFTVTDPGCGCSLPGRDRNAGGLTLLALGLAAALRRRRRRTATARD
jgi:MYXO-CTERM domain-containing protein